MDQQMCEELNKLSRVITEKYNDGLFRGQLQGGVRQGYGYLLVWDSSNNQIQYYQGNFDQGYKHGYGQQQEKDSIFYGQFDSGMKSGWGIQLTKGQEPLVGSWKFNLFAYSNIKEEIEKLYKNSSKYFQAKQRKQEQLINEVNQLKNENREFKAQNYDMKNYANSIYDNEDYYQGKIDCQGEPLRGGSGDHSTYVGSYQNNRKHGFGKQTFKKKQDQYLYEGNWKDDLKNGKGTLYKNQEVFYHGYWTNGKFDGKGFLVQNNQILFKGHFENGQRNQKGILIETRVENGKNQEIIIKCNWKDDEYLNGVGWEYNDSKPNVYIGQFKNSQRSGYGCLYSIQRNDKEKLEKIYEGEWENSFEHGYGQLRFAKFIYLGEFKHSQMTGYGHLYSIEEFKRLGYETDHSQQEGDNRESKIKDQLEKEFQLVSYIGYFLDGQKNGMGTLQLTDSRRYQGQFSKDMICGKGSFQFKNCIFKGEFKDHYFKGTIEGLESGFYEGQFSFEGRNGQGEMKWNKGETYKGEWKNNQMNGRGVYQDKQNKIEYSGLFEGGSFKDGNVNNIMLSTTLPSKYLKQNPELQHQKDQIMKKKKEYENEIDNEEIPDERNLTSMIRGVYYKENQFYGKDRLKEERYANENNINQLNAENKINNLQLSKQDSQNSKNRFEDLENKNQHMNSLINQYSKIQTMMVKSKNSNLKQIDRVEVSLSSKPIFVLLVVGTNQFTNKFKENKQILYRIFDYTTLDILGEEINKFKQYYITIIVIISNNCNTNYSDVLKFQKENGLSYLFMEQQHNNNNNNNLSKSDSTVFYETNDQLENLLKSQITAPISLDLIPCTHLDILLGKEYQQYFKQLSSNGLNEQLSEFYIKDFKQLINHTRILFNQINYKASSIQDYFEVIITKLGNMFKEIILFKTIESQFNEEETLPSNNLNLNISQEYNLSYKNLSKNEQHLKDINQEVKNQDDDNFETQVIKNFIEMIQNTHFVDLMNKMMKFSNTSNQKMFEYISPLLKMTFIALQKDNKNNNNLIESTPTPQPSDMSVISFKVSDMLPQYYQPSQKERSIPEKLYSTLRIHCEHLRYLQGQQSKGQTIIIPQFLQASLSQFTRCNENQQLDYCIEVILEIDNNHNYSRISKISVNQNEGINKKCEYLYHAYSAFKIIDYQDKGMILKLKLVDQKDQYVKL